MLPGVLRCAHTGNALSGARRFHAMNARHTEKRVTMFMGEELVYYVTVFETLPAPSQENPYAEGGRCAGKLQTSIRPVAPAPAAPKRVPTKTEYIRSFAKAGALPRCVAQTVIRNLALVRNARKTFGI